MNPPPTEPAVPLKVLLVDDDDLVRSAYTRELEVEGVLVTAASGGEAAARLLEHERFDVVVSDVMMPGMTGVDLLRTVRTRDLDVPVILMTGSPMIETAAEAVEFGALGYLTKPFDRGALGVAVRRAGKMVRIARAEREALHLSGDVRKLAADRAGLEASFARALAQIAMVFQPVVSLSRRAPVAYEALLRSNEPTLNTPPLLLNAAERLGEEHALGRAIRASVARELAALPDGADAYVNLLPVDLADEQLFDPAAPLSAHAARIVLEITERHGLETVADVPARVRALRALGYRIAIDDLGAGYAGLSAFAQLEPQVVKLDMSLIRGLDAAPTKRTLVASMLSLCRELGLEVICEGVETAAERDALAALGCDLLQGYFFARPARGFAAVKFEQ